MGKPIFIAMVLIALIGVPCSGRAQHSADEPEVLSLPEASEGQPMDTVEGELVSIDEDSQTILIRTADNQEIQFRYTAKTLIAGTGEPLQGLHETRGTRVRVRYTTDVDSGHPGETPAAIAVIIELLGPPALPPGDTLV